MSPHAERLLVIRKKNMSLNKFKVERSIAEKVNRGK
jgi:hypothetical protein